MTKLSFEAQALLYECRDFLQAIRVDKAAAPKRDDLVRRVDAYFATPHDPLFQGNQHILRSR